MLDLSNMCLVFCETHKNVANFRPFLMRKLDYDVGFISAGSRVVGPTELVGVAVSYDRLESFEFDVLNPTEWVYFRLKSEISF